jgi:hypothetical protein
MDLPFSFARKPWTGQRPEHRWGKNLTRRVHFAVVNPLDMNAVTPWNNATQRPSDEPAGFVPLSTDDLRHWRSVDTMPTDAELRRFLLRAAELPGVFDERPEQRDRLRP